MFYRRTFVEYPLPVRALISDFLVGQTTEPSDLALSDLKKAVALPIDEVPKIEAPVWNSKFGTALDYEQARKKVAAG